MQEPVMLDITVSRREKLVEYVIHSAEPDPIDAMPCLTVNGIDDIIISCRSCVISQSRAKVSAGFTIVSGLAVEAFDLVYCSLSVFRSVFVPDTLISSLRKVVISCGQHGIYREGLEYER